MLLAPWHCRQRELEAWDVLYPTYTTWGGHKFSNRLNQATEKFKIQYSAVTGWLTGIELTRLWWVCEWARTAIFIGDIAHAHSLHILSKHIHCAKYPFNGFNVRATLHVCATRSHPSFTAVISVTISQPTKSIRRPAPMLCGCAPMLCGCPATRQRSPQTQRRLKTQLLTGDHLLVPDYKVSSGSNCDRQATRDGPLGRVLRLKNLEKKIMQVRKLKSTPTIT